MKPVPFLLLCLFATGALAQQPQLELRSVVTGLSDPVGIAHAGDTRLFVVQQGGRIVIFDGTRVLPTPFLDVASLISTNGSERGLLGVAFHPRYSENGRFFIWYTDRQGDVTIARYSVSASDPNRADPNSGVVLVEIAHSQFPNHNGGQLAFGPDRYLYLGTGDGGSGGDPNNRAQNLGDLLGKILRIDVDSGTTYGIPPSNPFANRAGARPEIWAYGMRNPWRFSFDRATGDLWIADVGQGLYEEIDFQPATSIGGENYGWRRMEATHCFNPPSNCTDPALVLPIVEYGHTNGACSVTGGYVYRGTRYPKFSGTYFYGDYCIGTIWGATRNAAGSFTSRQLLDTNLLISTFGEDVAGELYVADHNGTIYQLTDVSPGAPRRRAVVAR
jgi:glucose/arabinose dehydrogenase